MGTYAGGFDFSEDECIDGAGDTHEDVSGEQGQVADLDGEGIERIQPEECGGQSGRRDGKKAQCSHIRDLYSGPRVDGEGIEHVWAALALAKERGGQAADMLLELRLDDKTQEGGGQTTGQSGERGGKVETPGLKVDEGGGQTEERGGKTHERGGKGKE